MKKHISFAILTVLVTGVTLIAGDAGYAQRRRARGKLYTKAEVQDIIKRVEDRSDEFKKLLDKSLDKSRLDDTKREDELNKYAKDLEKALDELRREFDRRDAWIENRAEVRKCLDIASELDVAMRRRAFGGETERTWVALRYDLNTLAKVYDLPIVGARAY
jgi:hypothetical protein